MALSRRRPVVAGNWKMNLLRAEARSLAAAVAARAAEMAGADLILIPPFTALGEVVAAVAGTPVKVGGQDLHWEDAGAYTGEISAPMLRDAGCEFVLVGHSERRTLFHETDESAARKVRAALRAGLRPILCVGETLEEREAGRTMERVGAQLEAGLSGLARGDVERLLLAYEPVWAIGTGRTASPAQAEEVHAAIREALKGWYGNETASCAIILYGGSVKPANSYALSKESDIDGFLVGGASLAADDFLGIVREALRAFEEVK